MPATCIYGLKHLGSRTVIKVDLFDVNWPHFRRWHSEPRSSPAEKTLRGLTSLKTPFPRLLFHNCNLVIALELQWACGIAHGRDYIISFCLQIYSKILKKGSCDQSYVMHFCQLMKFSFLKIFLIKGYFLLIHFFTKKCIFVNELYGIVYTFWPPGRFLLLIANIHVSPYPGDGISNQYDFCRQ